MIAVCLKWVDQRPEITDGTLPAPDSRFAGASLSDQAALEWALRCRDASGVDVLAITAGPPAADAVLRDALAAGATAAVRVDMPFGSASRAVAANIAAHLAGATTVWCGDMSADRGTGSVPAFIAAELAAAQALGLVAVELVDGSPTAAVRRLDGGRRERLAIAGPTVLSVEGSTAQLRRAGLRAMLGRRTIDVRPAVATDHSATATANATAATSRPFRPRPRVLAAPAGAVALDRIKVLTASASSAAHGETVTLAPGEAADRILAALRDWGYIS